MIKIDSSSRCSGAAELVLIPSPGAGHLAPFVEIAKILVDRDDRLSITILIMHLPFDDNVSTYTLSVSKTLPCSRIKFINLPHDHDKQPLTLANLLTKFIEDKKPQVKEVVRKLIDEDHQLAGFVLDMFCTYFTDVADELQLPSYVFFTSSAAVMASMLHAQFLYHQDQLIDSDVALEIPGLLNSVPARLFPACCFDQGWAPAFFEQHRRFRSVKGIMINTFEELESRVIRSFSDGITGMSESSFPPVYTVGPLLSLTSEIYDLGPGGVERKAEIMTWLDGQPDSSVVFLCFGSMGSFAADQVREVASALEVSGHRFLWSLRRPPPKGKTELPSDYVDPTDVLPEGFLDRTAKIGKVTGWVPQINVLGHPAVGGFVSHCGWNSTLEGIWFGAPTATWPMYAEQQFNAFHLSKELQLAVEIKIDYRNVTGMENPMVVSAEEIERGIRCLMEPDSEMRKRRKEMKENARRALMDGGSSFSSVGRFIDDVFNNMSK